LLKLTVDPDPGFAVKEMLFTYNPAHKTCMPLAQMARRYIHHS